MFLPLTSNVKFFSTRKQKRREDSLSFMSSMVLPIMFNNDNCCRVSFYRRGFWFSFSARGSWRVRCDTSRRHHLSMAVPFARRILHSNRRKRGMNKDKKKTLVSLRGETSERNVCCFVCIPCRSFSLSGAAGVPLFIRQFPLPGNYGTPAEFQCDVNIALEETFG